jgi:DNA-binding LacI/PurR family transcriptional regulator
MVLSGVESVLSKEGFFYLTASHLHRDDLLEHHPKMLLERQVEGIIAVDTPIRFQTDLPVVSISGHDEIKGVTKIALNHRRAAALGVEHLFALGHRKIAFIKGQNFSSDTEIRWQTISRSMSERGLEIDAKLVTQLEGDTPSPEIGYVAAQKILAARKPFTALFAFNDVSAWARSALCASRLERSRRRFGSRFRRHLRGGFSQSDADDHSPAAFRDGTHRSANPAHAHFTSEWKRRFSVRHFRRAATHRTPINRCCRNFK